MPKVADKSSPFSRRLAELIRASGRSQTEFARMAGVSDQYVSDLVTGARGGRMPAETVVGICRALGLSATAAGRLLYELHPEKSSNEGK